MADQSASHQPTRSAPPWHPAQTQGGGPAADPELAALLHQIVGPDGAFRHREHIHLAFLAVRRYGTAEAKARICGWIKQIAAYEHAPQKYHQTVSEAWVELVGHHVAERPDLNAFPDFAAAFPPLLDKRLLARHYRSSTLAAQRARHTWVAPDLAPFPWTTTASRSR